MFPMQPPTVPPPSFLPLTFPPPQLPPPEHPPTAPPTPVRSDSVAYTCNLNPMDLRLKLAEKDAILSLVLLHNYGQHTIAVTALCMSFAKAHNITIACQVDLNAARKMHGMKCRWLCLQEGPFVPHGPATSPVAGTPQSAPSMPACSEGPSAGGNATNTGGSPTGDSLFGKSYDGIATYYASPLLPAELQQSEQS